MLNGPDEITSTEWMTRFQVTSGPGLKCIACQELVEVGMYLYNGPDDANTLQATWTDVTDNSLDQFWACAAGHFLGCVAIGGVPDGGR
jgi:hypothetical protein